jgi:hypothetical protein
MWPCETAGEAEKGRACDGVDHGERRTRGRGDRLAALGIV